mmetsp:Transcript_59862/g.107511  ORF Transcript_59862/g.107511 Transcript_59862/m.107511 type:complete len:485 (-) Transcript_59862:60-1514(-)
MAAGEPTVMTDEQKAEWLEKKTAELDELMPMSDIEFEDMVSEQTWQWGRHLLPFQNHRRHEIAEYKRTFIQKQPELFKKLRLWHPLALKYPTLLKRWNNDGPSSIENRNLDINVEFLANEEKIAGFTYADFLKETAGNKFTNEGWVAPQIGDVVEGTIMHITEDGAFVQIKGGGVKSWAQLPTNLASLKPISSVKDVGLEVGAEIKAEIVEKDYTSVVLGDSNAAQYLLSLSSLELDAAWNKAVRTFNSEEGFDPLWEVQVMAMAPWGCSVMTQEGLLGMIPARDLGDKAGDAALVGAFLNVRIQELRPDKRDITNPQMVVDYPIVFSYANVMKRVLAEKIKEGDVLEGKITNFLGMSMDVEVEGIPFPMKKLDISGNQRFNMMDVFTVDEVVKVYCISSDPTSGDIRFSMRALEPRPGAILLNKQKVFDEAEETAKKFFEKATAEKEKLAENLREELSEPKATTAGSALDSILGDEDEDAGIF